MDDNAMRPDPPGSDPSISDAKHSCMPKDGNWRSPLGLLSDHASTGPSPFIQPHPLKSVLDASNPSRVAAPDSAPRISSRNEGIRGSSHVAQYSSQIPMRFQHDVPVPPVLNPGDAVLGGTFMLDVVQHMKDLAAAGEFFGNTSCTPCSGKNIYEKQMRFYCVEYRQKNPTSPKCAVRLQLRKLRARPGWVVYKEGDHIHPALPQSKKSNRFKCLLRSLADVDRDASLMYTRRTPVSPWVRGEAPLILPNLPSFHPRLVHTPIASGPGGFIVPRAVFPPNGLPSAAKTETQALGRTLAPAVAWERKQMTVQNEFSDIFTANNALTLKHPSHESANGPNIEGVAHDKAERPDGEEKSMPQPQ